MMLELIGCILVGMLLAYYFIKQDWLATKKQIAQKRYEAMQERINDLCESGDPDDREVAVRLTAELAEHYAELEYEERQDEER